MYTKTMNNLLVSKINLNNTTMTTINNPLQESPHVAAFCVSNGPNEYGISRLVTGSKEVTKFMKECSESGRDTDTLYLFVDMDHAIEEYDKAWDLIVPSRKSNH